MFYVVAMSSAHRLCPVDCVTTWTNQAKCGEDDLSVCPNGWLHIGAMRGLLRAALTAAFFVGNGVVCGQFAAARRGIHSGLCMSDAGALPSAHSCTASGKRGMGKLLVAL